MRLVIGFLVAAVVLLVAIVTLVITYSVGLASLRNLALDYSESLVSSARIRTEHFIRLPTTHVDLLRKHVLLPGYMLPSDEPDVATWAHKYYRLFTDVFLLSNRTYTSGGIVFEDGSGISTDWLDSPARTWLSLWGTNFKTAAAANNFTPAQDFQQIFVNNMTEPSVYFRPAEVRKDARFPAYKQARSIFTTKQGFWAPLALWQPFDRQSIGSVDTSTASIFFTLAPGVRLYNASNYFLGMGTVTLDLTSISIFLNDIKAAPDSEVFALDGLGYIMSSTHSRTFFTSSTHTNPNLIIGPGCASTAQTATEPFPPVFVMACRSKYDAFGFPPLALASPKVLFTSTQAVQLVDTGSEQYYVVSASVRSIYVNFLMNIVFTMPETVIIRDIVSGRNLAIGCTAAVFFVACIASFALVYILLLPLDEVSRRMRDTARLREDGDGEVQFSSLTEVRDLQRSYHNMNAAIQSFTKYVPRDVVTDLMQSGQLCAIRMTSMRCTSLFTDIQGFTTICERVPVDQLSILVSEYFEIMSRIVMKHDGLIDKYIGDCIMAVWGAPFPLPNQEAKATLTGLLLNRETLVDPLACAFDDAGEELGIRVGINSGEVLAGNMGSTQRMNYTVIGDPVNLAARLESLNKQFGTRVMISEDTREGLGSLFCLRLLMSIAVVGKALPVKVYEVVGLGAGLSADDRERMANLDASHAAKVAAVDDTDSLASSIQTSTGTTVATRASHQAVALFHEALSLSDAPLVASELDQGFARDFTECVSLYSKTRFAQALEKLQAMQSTYPPHILGRLSKVLGQEIGPKARKNTSAEKSIDVLTRCCEQFLNNPTGFTGYFTADEK